MPRFGEELGEGKAGTQKRGGTRDGQTLQGLTGTWVQAEVGKGRIAPARETAADAGTRRGEQG